MRVPTHEHTVELTVDRVREREVFVGAQEGVPRQRRAFVTVAHHLANLAFTHAEVAGEFRLFWARAPTAPRARVRQRRIDVLVLASAEVHELPARCRARNV